MGILAGAASISVTENFWLALAVAGYLERAAVEGYKTLRGGMPGKFLPKESGRAPSESHVKEVPF